MTQGWGYGGSRRRVGSGGRDGRRSPVDKSRDRGRRHGGKHQRSREDSRSRSRRQPAPRARGGDDQRGGGEARNALTYRAKDVPPRASRSRDRGREKGRRRGRNSDSPQSLSDQAANELAEEVAESVDEEDGSEYTSGSYESTSDVAGADVDKAKAKETPKEQKKDDIVHFDWKKGMVLYSRYLVTRLLGDGTFGRVLQVRDQKKDRQLAVKVIRNIEKYIRNAKREAEILKDIRQADAVKAAGCVRMHDIFWHQTAGGDRFFCIAFEVLGASLYDLLKHNRFRGLWVQDIQSIARQSLEALAFLHDELSLSHTDLKLENVLFISIEPHLPADFPREALYQTMHRGSKSASSSHQYMRPASNKVKLIDFGNATYELEHHSSIINTRQYRAPEVILAMGWNERSDLWSLGCILMELYTGELLFRTHESLEHLALMERTVDRFPATMLARASVARQDQFLHQEQPPDGLDWRLYWPEKASTTSSEKSVRVQRPLHSLVQEAHRPMADFVASLLILEPGRRPSAKAALVHPFLFEQFSD